MSRRRETRNGNAVHDQKAMGEYVRHCYTSLSSMQVELTGYTASYHRPTQRLAHVGPDP